MVNIIKEEIELDESLKKKLEFICDFAKVKPAIINGSIRRIIRQILLILNHIELLSIMLLFLSLIILMKYL